MRTLALIALLPAVAFAAHPVVPSGRPPPEAEPDAGPPPPEPSQTAEPVKPTRPAGPVKPADSGKSGTSSTPGPTATPVMKSTEPTKPSAPPTEITKAKLPENPAEVAYRQKAGDHYFELHVKPGAPKPNDHIEFLLEVALIHDPPDPVQGEHEPVQNEELVATFTKGGGPGGKQRVLHATGVPGEYGLHLTPEESGVHPLVVSRRTGKPGMDVTFPIGIGVPTPGRPDDVLVIQGAGGGRAPLRVNMPGGGTETGAGGGDMVALMKQIGQHWMALDVATTDPKADIGGHAKALADLAAPLKGRVPTRFNERRQEWDGQAASFQSAMQDLIHVADRNQLKTKMLDLEQNSCLKCHAQFWFGVADDVSSWPNFTLATPSSNSP
jgi:hypothetical protein